MSDCVSYPKGDLRRMLSVLAATDLLDSDAALVNLASQRAWRAFNALSLNNSCGGMVALSGLSLIAGLHIGNRKSANRIGHCTF